MNWIERLARAEVEALRPGRMLTGDQLFSTLGLPDTWSAGVQFHQALHYARHHLCPDLGARRDGKTIKREIVTIRSGADANSYLMPRAGNWLPFVQYWLPVFDKDITTRHSTEVIMLECWRHNHSGHVPPRLLREMNAIIDDEQDLLRRKVRVLSTIVDFVGSMSDGDGQPPSVRG